MPVRSTLRALSATRAPGSFRQWVMEHCQGVVGDCPWPGPLRRFRRRVEVGTVHFG